MENLKDLIQKSMVNEARQIEYRVAFIGTRDEDGLPYGVSILVDKEYQRDFENFLDNEQDNIFAHADGGTVEY